MVDQIQGKIDTALDAWEAWNELGISSRNEIMLRWAQFITPESQLGVLAEKMIKYQSRNALALLAEESLLAGPTGETNELYSAGRGVFVIGAAQGSPVASIVAQICVALLAGNCVFIALPPQKAELTQILRRTLLASGVPENVVQASDGEALETVLNAGGIAGIAYTGDAATATALNRQLAARSGSLVQLIAETDLDTLASASDTHYILRFITERTRTINITAVGGNATLLELGGGGH